VRDLYIEGARWDSERNCLAEALPMELSSKMPVIRFKPVEKKKKSGDKTKLYSCPLYYYPIRTGTRERPSFVLFVDLPSGHKDAEHWIKRGTALFLSTTN
jgi:dynein heavy chain